MRTDHRPNRSTTVGFLICTIIVLLLTNLGFQDSLAQSSMVTLTPSSMTSEGIPSLTPTLVPTTIAVSIPAIEAGKPATLTLPGLPVACVNRFTRAAPGEAVIGLDPQTCVTKKEPVHLRVDIPIKVRTPDSFATVTIRCEGDHPCQQNLVPSIGVTSQFSLGLNGRLLWTTVCIQGSTCNYLAPRRDVQVTFRVPTSGVYPLDFVVTPGAVWLVSGIDVALQPLPSPEIIRGYAYSPYRDCQSPRKGISPTTQEVGEDLNHMFQISNAIRTYSSLGINQEIAIQAKKLGFTVGLGIDLSQDLKKNEQEIMQAVKLAKQGQADFIIVGNEVILRKELTPDQVARYLLRVKKETGLPVAYGEVTSGFVEYNKSGELISKQSMSPIIKAADLILVHIYPYWDGVSIDQGAAYVASIDEQIKRLFPNKRVIIGETGWPSRGNQNGNAIPTLENQRRFFLEFSALAAQKGIEYFYFSPYEEPWKAPEAGEIGISWGINTPERTNKFETDSLFFPRQAPAAQQKPGAPAFNPLPTQTVIPTGQPAANNQPYVLYQEFPSPDTMSASWWQGDRSDISFTDCSKNYPNRGQYAIQAQYRAETANEPGQLGWAGIIWEYPENNHGSLRQGRDLSKYKSLHFFARGENGGEKVAFIVGGTQTGSHPSSIRQPLIMEVTLGKGWQEYAFDLRGIDLSHVIDGFGWVASSCKNPGGVSFYLDDIAYQTDVVTRPAANELPILENGCLRTGFDLGIDTSGKERHWAAAAEDALKLVYPARQLWGAAFIYVNQKNWYTRPYVDLSMYNTLEIEMRGEVGGEKVSIGIKDNSDPDNGTETKNEVTLGSTWQTYRFPLAAFRKGLYADLAKIYIPVEFVFPSPSLQPVTIYIRSVKYLHK
jgi:exo-beta-1,3-glucanase (GH17 family)